MERKSILPGNKIFSKFFFYIRYLQEQNMIVKIVISLTNYTRTRLNPIKTCMSHVERAEEGSNCELCQLDEHKICNLKARK